MGPVAHRPLIGVTTSEVRLARHARPLPEGDPPQPEMALGVVYARAVERAGGLPVVLPPLEAAAVAPLVEQLAGVCLSGGPDLDPAGYEAEQDPNLGPIEPALDAFEFAVARQADELGMPVLGICRGCQTLNVARGGTLHQHLPDVTDGSIDHRQAVSGLRPTHAVEIERDSRLAAIVGGEQLHVNSFHHQAVDRLGRGLRVVARATDGVVEGIEQTGGRLYLGVQWHVETLVEHPRHACLFETLVAEAAEYAKAVTGRAA
jgi:putative glutamine amidotransferase